MLTGIVGVPVARAAKLVAELLTSGSLELDETLLGTLTPEQTGVFGRSVGAAGVLEPE